MRTRRTQMLAAAVVSVALLATVACQDATLGKAATYLKDIATTVNSLTANVITANQQGLVSDQTTKDILGVIAKVDNAGLQADAVVRNLSKLDPNSKANLYQIIHPVEDAMNSQWITEATGIKDTATRQKIQLGLVALQTSLNALSGLFQ